MLEKIAPAAAAAVVAMAAASNGVAFAATAAAAVAEFFRFGGCGKSFGRFGRFSHVRTFLGRKTEITWDVEVNDGVASQGGLRRKSLWCRGMRCLCSV